MTASSPSFPRPGAAPDSLPPLPADAAFFLPHQPPMRLIDRLLAIGEDGSGVAETQLRAGNPLLDAQGRLEPAACIELVAQAYAAVHGRQQAEAGAGVRAGRLVGVRTARLTGEARVGDTLTVRVRPAGCFDAFIQVQSEVVGPAGLLAEVTLSVWVEPA